MLRCALMPVAGIDDRFVWDNMCHVSSRCRRMAEDAAFKGAKRKEAAKRSFGAELLLQHMAREYLKEVQGLSEDVQFPLQIAQHPGGKPYFEDMPDLHFNVSHSGDYALCAISGHPVGADIQQVRTMKADVAAAFFTLDERLYINTAEDKEIAFFMIWAAKESFVKATGDGLSMGLKSFGAVPQKDSFKRFNVKGPGVAGDFKDYAMECAEPAAGYVAAVCAPRAEFEGDVSCGGHRFPIIDPQRAAQAFKLKDTGDFC